jgi:glycosyltransferase involved in cell wall biosynthesis
MAQTSLCIVNNIPSPYRGSLFQAMAQEAKRQDIDFSVLYLARSESVRDWKIDPQPYETILPVLWQKRDKRTTTSDLIINSGFVWQGLKPSHMILFGYNYPTYLIIALLRRLSGQPTALFCETTLHDTSNIAWKKRLKSFLFKTLFSHFIVPGQSSEEYLRAHNVHKTKISKACNASPMRPNSAPDLTVTSPQEKHGLRLLYVGRLAEEKRIVEFAQTFATLETGSLTIVGEGPKAEDLKDLAKQYPQIKLLGSKTAEELPALYASHDVLVLVSNREPWGLVVNEAINHGLALLLSREIGSARDLLQDNGLYLEQISANQIAKVLEQLENNLPTYRQASWELAQKVTVERQATAFLSIANRQD